MAQPLTSGYWLSAIPSTGLGALSLWIEKLTTQSFVEGRLSALTAESQPWLVPSSYSRSRSRRWWAAGRYCRDGGSPDPFRPLQ